MLIRTGNHAEVRGEEKRLTPKIGCDSIPEAGAVVWRCDSAGGGLSILRGYRASAFN